MEVSHVKGAQNRNFLARILENFEKIEIYNGNSDKKYFTNMFWLKFFCLTIFFEFIFEFSIEILDVMSNTYFFDNSNKILRYLPPELRPPKMDPRDNLYYLSYI